jgi:hypothetical protein
MVTRQRLVSCVLVFSLAVTTTGCTSMKTVRPETSPRATAFGNAKAGDTVIVRTTDGRTTRFVVQQIDGDALIAPGGVRFTRAEVAELKRRSFSGAKTAGLTAGIVGGVLLLLGAAVASAYDGLLGS